MTVVVHGYAYSVYTTMVRFALSAKNVSFQYVEVNPFEEDIDKNYLNHQPFCAVPAFEHEHFKLYETTAITRYIDEAFSGPSLQPTDAIQRARMMQLTSIINAYAYPAMIRQVFEHRVFRPKAGEKWNEETIQAGLVKSKTVLAAIESIIASQNTHPEYLCGTIASLADIHLAPVIDYFQQSLEGAEMLSQFSRLSTWWCMIQNNHHFIQTRPDLSTIHDA